MEFFIDTADVEAIRKANDMGFISGVTTNPSLIAKEGKDFHATIKEIASIVDGPISAEVLADDAPVKLRKVVLQILDRLTVEFHDSHIMSAFEQELRKHAHSRSHFEHRHSSIIVERGSYTVCHVKIGQKMLPEKFLWFYVLHN